jgi:hypothetical protein
MLSPPANINYHGHDIIFGIQWYSSDLPDGWRMLAFVLRRLLGAIPTLLVIITLAFF